MKKIGASGVRRLRTLLRFSYPLIHGTPHVSLKRALSYIGGRHFVKAEILPRTQKPNKQTNKQAVKARALTMQVTNLPRGKRRDDVKVSEATLR